MTIWESLLLGLIQGVTEFLPVSSSGHLVIGQALLDIRLPGVAFEVAVHLGTLVSVLAMYGRRLGALAVGALKGRPESWSYVGLILVSTIPGGVAALAVRELIDSLFEIPAVAGAGLLVTGLFLWTSRRALSRGPSGLVGFRVALLMGVAQAFAILPGISRSGATVVTGLWLGVEAEEAAEFSFLMLVPATLGAAVLELWGPEAALTSVETGPLLYGSAAAALTGVVAIWAFVAMLKKRSFHRFGPYCLAVGAAFLLFLGVRG